MMVTLEIGATPCDEDCAQVGSPDYHTRARAECKAYIEQIRREHGPEPEGARLFIKSNPHDFGSYLEVACKFDEENDQATDYAYKVESEGSPRWDEEARKVLGIKEREES